MRFVFGGVPERSPEDYWALYAAGRRGNFPLVRTYSGADDFIFQSSELFTLEVVPLACREHHNKHSADRAAFGAQTQRNCMVAEKRMEDLSGWRRRE
jgi:hypothetical protein